MTNLTHETRRFAPPPFKGYEERPPAIYIDELISAASIGAFAASLVGPAPTIFREVLGSKGLYVIKGFLAVTTIASLAYTCLLNNSAPPPPPPPLTPRPATPDPEYINLISAYKNKDLNKENSHSSHFEDPPEKLSTGSRISFSADTVVSHDKEGKRPSWVHPTPSGWILTKDEKIRCRSLHHA